MSTVVVFAAVAVWLLVIAVRISLPFPSRDHLDPAPISLLSDQEEEGGLPDEGFSLSERDTEEM